MTGTVLGADNAFLAKQDFFRLEGRLGERKMIDPGKTKSMCKGQEMQENKLFQISNAIQNKYLT